MAERLTQLGRAEQRIRDLIAADTSLHGHIVVLRSIEWHTLRTHVVMSDGADLLYKTDLDTGKIERLR